MRIVITGKNSYIGNSFQKYVERQEDHTVITQLDVADETWKEFDFTGYDVVLHVAAIVHQKEISDWSLYKRVNTDLPIEIAKKAKAQGVKQFVFLSTMAVYGQDKTLSKTKSIITNATKPNPTSMYGKSKYLAEIELSKLECASFNVVIIRPPNVYGPDCKGAYIKTYQKITEALPVIPYAFDSVKQSVIYIDNLSNLIYTLITQCKSGVFTPQDKDAVSAVQIMKSISRTLGLRKKTSVVTGAFMYLLFFLPIVQKGYGGISYADDISEACGIEYAETPFEIGLERTVLYDNHRNNSCIEY